jgi:cleavage and polyadenylation specificity factor subunit 2
MLRVTPLSGSGDYYDDDVYDAEDYPLSQQQQQRQPPPWNPQSNPPVCELIEWSGCRVLVNMGPTMMTMFEHEDDKDNTASVSSSPPNHQIQIPQHDCLLLTDSTLTSLGGLALYFRYMKQQQQQQKRYRRKMTNNKTGEEQTEPQESEEEDSLFYLPPIYATFPTVKMGQMTLYDHHASICLDGGNPGYTLQDIDDVFAHITAIKYSQQKYVTSTTAGNQNKPILGITAQRAGHVVGGAFYILKRLLDETVVVITETYHVAKELHLDSSTLLQHAATPDVLITRPGGPAFGYIQALQHPPPVSSGSSGGRPILASGILVSTAEKNLIEAVLSVLRRDGNVLLPVDCSGRVLEIVLLLNQTFSQQRLTAAYDLIWFAPMCRNVVEFARAQLEWMAKALGTQFDSGKGHPYQLKAVQLCTSIGELDAIMEEHQNPVCVLASGLSLEGGPARDVFLKFADNPDNAIIFTDSSQCYLRKRKKKKKTKDFPAAVHMREANVASTTMDLDGSNRSAVLNEEQDGVVSEAGEEGRGGIMGSVLSESMRSPWTTSAQLLLAWAKAKFAGTEMEDSIMVDVNVPVKAPLAGAEFREFLAAEEAARQKLREEEEKRAMLAQVELAKGQLRLGEDDRSSQPAAAVVEPSKAAVSSTSVRPRKKSRFDSTLFLKFSKPLHCTYIFFCWKNNQSHFPWKLTRSRYIFSNVRLAVTFDFCEEAVGIGQNDSMAKFGIGESVGRSGEVLEDDYGIAVLHDKFTDIVSGVDPSKFAGGTGRIGEEVLRRGFGFGVDKVKSTAANQSQTRAVSEDDEHHESAYNEHALEAMDLSEGNGIIRGRGGRPPVKVKTVPRKVEVLAEVSYIPGLEGRVDAKAAKLSVRALQPQEVVVLGGTMKGKPYCDDEIVFSDEVALFAEGAKSFMAGNKKIYTPSNGETIDLAVGHSAYSVRLIDVPYMSPKSIKASEPPPQPVELFEVKLGQCTVSLLDYVATGQRAAVDDSIVLAPSFPRALDDSPSLYLSDGEVVLTDLLAEITASGMKAEYSVNAGYAQLLINGKILLRKEHGDEWGKVSVEGPLCEDFYTVRSILCGQYVTL